MNCYIQTDCITPDTLDFVKQHADIQGVVLGDYTCNRRMFSGGCAGLVKSIDQYTGINKEVILQTPIYATSRNFDEIMDGISFLRSEYHVKKYLVQDVGVLAAIVSMVPDSELIWSQMGRNRANVFNMESVLFLQKQGLTGMEVDSGLRMSALNSCGMKAYALYGSIRYKSISRNCYNRYFHRDTVCRIDCRDHRTYMTTKGNRNISMDGFFLDKAYHYDDSPAYWHSVWDNCENIVIHAERLETAMKYYKNYKETARAYEQDFSRYSRIQ